jgi:site-specific DNA-adenine methylase
MVKEINIIRRIGSKQNDIKHFSKYLPLDVKTVVEPFGGSFAVCKWFYKDINKYNFHINDLDEEMYYIYKNVKEMLDVTKYLSTIFDKTQGYSVKKYLLSSNINKHISNYLIKNTIINGGIFNNISPTGKYCVAETDILNNSKFTNEDYKTILEQYKDEKDAFVFLDPPYLFSNNSGYYPQTEDTDATHIIPYILEYLKISKCKVMLIINKLGILEYLFKDFIKGEYQRIYQISNKKSVHLIITNYDL